MWQLQLLIVIVNRYLLYHHYDVYNLRNTNLYDAFHLNLWYITNHLEGNFLLQSNAIPITLVLIYGKCTAQ
jgi:hypothetical protein